MGRQVTLRPRMRTLVITDLHLGSRRPVDILRRPEPLDALCAYLGDVDRLVLLGDVLELRHGPLREALGAARPVFEALGAALPKGAEVVITAGNHDYRARRAVARRAGGARGARRRSGCETRTGAAASPATRAIDEWLGRKRDAQRRLPGHLAARRRLGHARALPRPAHHRPDVRAPRRRRHGPRRRPAPGGRLRRPRARTSRRRSRRCTPGSTRSPTAAPPAGAG